MNITVEDENDNPPAFDRQSYEGRVEENTVPEAEVKLEVPLRIQDPDLGVNAQFMVMLKGNGSEFFFVDQKLQKILVKEGAILDREVKDTYHLKLVAKDRGTV